MTHRSALLALPFLALALSLSACGGDTGAASEVSSSPTPAATTTTPTPTETTATPQQLASVVAGYEADWRDTIDGAAECRVLWAMPSDDNLEQMQAATCWAREQTIVLNAGNASRDLQELDAPGSMTDLYADTLVALDSIKAVDLNGACGTDTLPSMADECYSTLGDLYVKYSDLETILDQWGPYL